MTVQDVRKTMPLSNLLDNNCDIHCFCFFQDSASVRIEGFKSSDVFELMQNALATSGAELTKKVGGVFLFKVAGDGGAQGSWVVDAKNNGGSVRIAKEGIQIVFIPHSS